MKSLSKTLVFSVALLALAGGCKGSATPVDPEEAAIQAQQNVHLLFERPNPVAGVSVQFFGTALDPNLHPPYMIDFAIIKDLKAGKSIKYAPESETRQAADFYFADVWSPGQDYLVLPLDKKDGFAIFNAKTAIADIEVGRYADTVRVIKGEARRYWHSFEKWDGSSAFRFKGEIEGRAVSFKYDIKSRQLFCVDVACSPDDRARNLTGSVQLRRTD
jgi:hypothetical protein